MVFSLFIIFYQIIINNILIIATQVNIAPQLSKTNEYKRNKS
jgi:hypothetical protein